MPFDQIQQEAIRLATTFDPLHRIVAITGQAGTGKTTIMQQVYNLAISAGYKTICCAPTGKAAKRILEATGIQAVTVHRLLCFGKPNDIDPKTGKPLGKSYPSRCRDNPIPYDVVLCDEGAMITQELHRFLLDALPALGYLRYFGDINQLPPIEDDVESSVFEQLLRERPSIRLTNIHRTSRTSNIPSAADLLLRGRIPPSTDDFKVVNDDNPLKRLKQLVEADPKLWSGLDGQIIVAMRQRKCGSTALSQMIQDMVNPPGHDALRLPRHKWDEHNHVLVSPGDKVIVTQNDYEVEVFNGETGVVVDYDDDYLNIDFGDRLVAIPRWESIQRPWEKVVYSPWCNIALAYAITCHKSQGSEWQNVAVVLDQMAAFMQTKALVYTAVTRARQNVILFSDLKSLQSSVQRIKRKPIMKP